MFFFRTQSSKPFLFVSCTGFSYTTIFATVCTLLWSLLGVEPIGKNKDKGHGHEATMKVPATPLASSKHHVIFFSLRTPILVDEGIPLMLTLEI